MQRRRTFTVMAILIAVLVLGIGYAVVSNVTLNLNGSANVNANFDFTVVYDTAYTPVVSPTGNTTMSDNTTTHPYVTASATTSTATMTVWLDKDHTSAYAIFKIDNTSSLMGATLTSQVTNVRLQGEDSDSSYFNPVTVGYYSNAACTQEYELTDETVVPAGTNNSVYMKVTVSLAKAPLEDITTGTFTVTTTAHPNND